MSTPPPYRTGAFLADPAKPRSSKPGAMSNRAVTTTNLDQRALASDRLRAVLQRLEPAEIVWLDRKIKVMSPTQLAMANRFSGNELVLQVKQAFAREHGLPLPTPVEGRFEAAIVPSTLTTREP